MITNELFGPGTAPLTTNRFFSGIIFITFRLINFTRFVSSDLKIYVGEAFTGQALLQQAKEYHKIAGIDAFVLTKIDCDRE